MPSTSHRTTESSDVAVDTVVDVGSQIQENVDLYLPYVDEDSAAREFVDLSLNPRGDIYSGMSTFPMFEYKRAAGSSKPVNEGDITETIGTEAVNRQRDEYGIDVSIINPTLNLGLAEVNNDRFATALARGYNDWLLEELVDQDHLVGNMVVAPQHPAKAEEEIDRLGNENSIVGVNLPITGLEPHAGHRIYTPIYDAAERHGLPITLQPTVGVESFPLQFFSSKFFAEDHTYHHPFLLLQNLASILLEGIPERYPSLDFVLLDCGIGWGPYSIMRMDDHYLELGYEIPALDKLPSEYFNDSIYWGLSPLPTATSAPTDDYTAKMVEIIGADNVLFASDIPHPVQDSPKAAFDALAPHLETQELEKVFGRTAMELYDL